MRTVLIGCDQAYYDTWAISLLRSIQYHAPWVSLHCHIVNPKNLIELPTVRYTTEHRVFSNDESLISYLQAVRFKVAYEEYSIQPVMILDADSICTKNFTEQDYDQAVEGETVLHHPKADRWLAGLVATNNPVFLRDYYTELTSEPFNLWQWGRDQDILALLSKQYQYRSADKYWISIGKNGNQSVFLTLKGEQKTKEKYLAYYNKIKDQVC